MGVPVISFDLYSNSDKGILELGFGLRHLGVGAVIDSELNVKSMAVHFGISASDSPVYASVNII